MTTKNLSAISFSSGASIQAKDVASLVYESSHELLSFMFTSQEAAVTILTKLLSYSHGHFGNKFATQICVDGKVSGVELGYTRQQLKSQELIGTLNTFRATPVRLWPRLVGRVRIALDDYVPPPSFNAYYINNIAVSNSIRGRGLGRLLIENAADKAKNEGLKYIELDVTETNYDAIKFYVRNGFSHESTSGNDELKELYGLPKLYRMRLLLERL